MITTLCRLLGAVALLLSVASLAGSPALLGPGSSAAASFPLFVGGQSAKIVCPEKAPEVVKIAARMLAGDLSTITGVQAFVVPQADSSIPRIELVQSKELAGRWEAFRLSATEQVLTVEGSDARGLAYGVLEISRRLGVSPWQWWADVPLPSRTELLLACGRGEIEQPSVKYRGIFINDEDWGLVPWAAKTYEPEVGNLGPKTYARVFELMLRLRANVLWPGMHPTTTAFHQVPGNAATADAYAIILGSSHAEPMLRNNVGEWGDDKELYNFVTNREGVLAYWEQRVKERRSGESLFTLGMRGIHDSPIVGPKTQVERIATLTEIISEQRSMLARHLGKGDARAVPQIFCPYKEVLDDYIAGLQVPDDVTLVWPDDNFGYIRRYATDEERARKGGLGVYYHLSYLGSPMAWLWIDTMSPALIWSEMTRAYAHGADRLWVANVGDLKACERSTEFFLELAWNAGKADAGMPARQLRQAAARDFGPGRAEAVAGLLERLQALSFARRPEHLQWNLPKTPYEHTGLNEAEIARRLGDFEHLREECEQVEASLPAGLRDAFFELVAYPVYASAAANRAYFYAELARADIARGRSPMADQVSAEAGRRELERLTVRFNEETAGGKWRHVMSVNGLAPDIWQRFQPNPSQPTPDPTEENVAPPAPKGTGVLPLPADVRSGDFVERGGVVSMLARHFSGLRDQADGAGWRSIPGLGRSGGAITLLPPSARPVPGQEARARYRFHVSRAAAGTLHVRLLPSHPIEAGRGLRFAVAVDGAEPMPVKVMKGFDTHSDEWNRRVLANATEAVLELPGEFTAGWHELELIATDPGLLIDKLVIDLGGLQPSYDGPEETRIP